MEGAANRLQKEAKGYLDSLRGRNGMLLGRYKLAISLIVDQQ